MKGSMLIIAMILLNLVAVAQGVRKIKADELEKIIKESKHPLIVNFWATWCQPCIEEIPYFLDEAKKYRKDSLSILLVSLDFKEEFPEAIDKFMEKRKFKAPAAWLDETNADYFCPKVDPKWQGAIPATLFINNTTGYRKFYEEKVSHEDLKRELRNMTRE
jgi:thiol-disulfide isomerase/thioredoxin